MEELAALIDGRLPAAEAARVRAHLASCEDCYEVFAETLHLQEELRGEEKPEGALVPFPFEGRRKVRPSWAAAVAALLVAGVGVGLWWTEHPREAPDLSVAVLSAHSGNFREPGKVAWSEVTRGAEKHKEPLDRLSFRLGVELLHLQLALDSGNQYADSSAANVIGLLEAVDLLDPTLEDFYVRLRLNLDKRGPKSFAREAAMKAEALRHFASLEQAYFDLGAWAEAGRLAALSKQPAPSRGKEAAYLLGQLQKDKDADFPDDVVAALKKVEKLPADDYPHLKTEFEKILVYYYPQGRPYEG